jgi:hypothetical protein
MLQAVISTIIDGEALTMSPITLGRVPSTERSPDHFLIVSDENGSAIRFDLYGDESRHEATQVAIWKKLIIAAWGSWLAVVQLNGSKRFETEWSNIGEAKFIQTEDHFFILGDSHLAKISSGGEIAWESTSWDWILNDATMELRRVENNHAEVHLKVHDSSLECTVKVDLETGARIAELPESISLKCSTCGAIWGHGDYSEDCKECGGGAMERECMLCGGKCGRKWQKMQMDSNDTGVAHWGGECDSQGRQK